MKRVLVLLVFVAGCAPQLVPSVAEPPPVDPPASTVPAMPVAPAPHLASQSAEIEFSSWPTATRSPVDVSPHVAQMCEPSRSREAIWSTVGGEKRHGPHFKHSIVVRTNPDAMEEFKAGTAPMPVGTVVVKEKHSDPFADAKEPLREYGAMIKREPGYDPQHGDWEYLYVVRQPEKKVTRGRLESCIDCHSHAKDKDYLFRTYLPGKVGVFSEW